MSERVNRRLHSRLALDASIELFHSAFGQMSLRVKNMSDGGVFAYKGQGNLPPVGTELRAIIKRHTGPLNTEPVNMRVIRITADGLALQFI